MNPPAPFPAAWALASALLAGCPVAALDEAGRPLSLTGSLDSLVRSGGVRGSVHDKLNQAAGGMITEKFLNNKIPDPIGQRAEVEVFLDTLRKAYDEDLSMPGIALGSRKWFSDRGI